MLLLHLQIGVRALQRREYQCPAGRDQVGTVAHNAPL